MQGWIKLYAVKFKPVATGVQEFTAYVVTADGKEDALKKAVKVISGNYEPDKVQRVADLYDFGSDVYVPDEF